MTKKYEGDFGHLTEPLGMRLTPELFQQLKELAIFNHRTKSGVVRELIRAAYAELQAELKKETSG